MTLTAGDSLTLTCVGSNPEGAVSPLFFRWQFNSTSFNETDERIINEMTRTHLISILTIPNVSIDYRGDFTCHVSNRRSFETRNARSSNTMVNILCKLFGSLSANIAMSCIIAA